MRSLTFHQTGPLEDVIELCDVADPALRAGQVLVKVSAASLMPADRLFAHGRYRIAPVFPQRAGLFGSGQIVAENSPAGTSGAPTVGDRVVFICPGAWSEYVSVDSDKVYRIPDTLSSQRAALSFLNYFTALGLIRAGHVKPGDTVLVTAAGSSVAGWISLVSQQQGFSLIGTGRSKVDRSNGFVGRFFEVSDLLPLPSATELGTTVSAVIDCVGGIQGQMALDALSAGGSFVAYGDLSGEPIHLKNSALVYKNIVLRGFGIRSFLDSLGNHEIEKELVELALIAERAPGTVKDFTVEHYRELFTFRDGPAVFTF